MAPSIEQKLSGMLYQPWTLRVERTETGWQAFIEELPEYVAAADDADELQTAVWDSLRSLLMTYLEAGDTVPLPAMRNLESFRTLIWKPTPRGRAPTPPAGMSVVVGL